MLPLCVGALASDGRGAGAGLVGAGVTAVPPGTGAAGLLSPPPPPQAASASDAATAAAIC